MARVKKETKTVTKKADKVEKAATTKVKDAVVKETVKKAKALKAVPVKEVKIVEKAEKTKEPKKMKPQSKEDTGSVDFQINNFSEKIKLLAKHLKTHIHDFDSRRGLLIMVGKRRRLLNYLKKSDIAKYEEMSKTLKLKA